MIKRTVEIGRAAHLSLERRQLAVAAKDGSGGTLAVPIEDLGVLVLDDQRITCTVAVLSALSEANVAVVVCDSSHLPSGMFMPFEGHTLHQKHFQQQLKATPVSKKQAWTQIVRAKILAQAVTLEQAGIAFPSLRPIAAGVKSGDPLNAESRAAKLYFPALFGPDFLRRSAATGVNAALNYAYAILRAAVARAIAGSGMHPAVGIWHRNQYNAFTLADDLMEPLRPLADSVVYNTWQARGRPVEYGLDKEWRHSLLGILAWDFVVGKLKFPLIPSLIHYVSGVRQFFAGEADRIEIPVAIYPS